MIYELRRMKEMLDDAQADGINSDYFKVNVLMYKVLEDFETRLKELERK